MKTKINVETLDKAIADFNNWNRSAVLYYNQKENYFSTEVFLNDVQQAESVFSKDCFGILSKNDHERFRIGEIRRKYIIEYVDLVLDGWDPFQAEYQLLKKYANIY